MINFRKGFNSKDFIHIGKYGPTRRFSVTVRKDTVLHMQENHYEECGCFNDEACTHAYFVILENVKDILKSQRGGKNVKRTR